MNLLADLFNQLAQQPAASPLPTPGQHPASPVPAPAVDALQAEHQPGRLASADSYQQAATQPRRNAWTLTRNGKPAGYIVGQPMTRTEALADVLARGWKDAGILEN